MSYEDDLVKEHNKILFCPPDEWERVKEKGSLHYKKGFIEPIDIMKSHGILWNHAVCCVIKYAFRNEHRPSPTTISDMNKAIHYCEMIKAMTNEILRGEPNDEK